MDPRILNSAICCWTKLLDTQWGRQRARYGAQPICFADAMMSIHGSFCLIRHIYPREFRQLIVFQVRQLLPSTRRSTQALASRPPHSGPSQRPQACRLAFSTATAQVRTWQGQSKETPRWPASRRRPVTVWWSDVRPTPGALGRPCHPTKVPTQMSLTFAGNNRRRA